MNLKPISSGIPTQPARPAEAARPATLSKLEREGLEYDHPTHFDPAAPPDASQLEGRSANQALAVSMGTNAALAAAKFIPGVGNVLNLVNVVTDIRERLQFGINTSGETLTGQTLKTLAHAAGVIWPGVGAAFDLLMAGGNGMAMILDKEYVDLSPAATNNSMVNEFIAQARKSEE